LSFKVFLIVLAPAVDPSLNAGRHGDTQVDAKRGSNHEQDKKQHSHLLRHSVSSPHSLRFKTGRIAGIGGNNRSLGRIGRPIRNLHPSSQPASIDRFFETPAEYENNEVRTTPITTICHCAIAQAAPMHAVTQTHAAVVSPCT
jgi:hypothetical protein